MARAQPCGPGGHAPGAGGGAPPPRTPPCGLGLRWSRRAGCPSSRRRERDRRPGAGGGGQRGRGGEVCPQKKHLLSAPGVTPRPSGRPAQAGSPAVHGRPSPRAGLPGVLASGLRLGGTGRDHARHLRGGPRKVPCCPRPRSPAHNPREAGGIPPPSQGDPWDLWGRRRHMLPESVCRRRPEHRRARKL